MKKKLLIATLALASAMATVPFQSLAFQDTQKDYIEWISQMGIMNGYPDGEFKPKNTVTRAEITMILTKLLETEVRVRYIAQMETKNFKDMEKTKWAEWSILYSYHQKFINGYPNDTFRGQNPITWSEFSAILLRSLLVSKTYKNL